MTDDRGPNEIDLSKPNIARGYDYLLGGKDNFEVDRAFAQQWMEVSPGIVEEARQNRAFLRRVVLHLAVEAGISQFIDFGSGIPAQDNVHQVAQRPDPNARVVYTDNDPVVLVHSRALLANTPNTTVITADMRDVHGILAHPETTRLIDFEQPVAAMFVSVLHCIPDGDDPGGIVSTVLDAVPSGSYLAMSHLVSEDDEAARIATETMLAQTQWGRVRRPSEVAEFFGGLELVEPGLVDVRNWRPDAAAVDPDEDRKIWEYGGVARQP